MRAHLIVAAALLVGHATAFQLPFNIPFLSNSHGSVSSIDSLSVENPPNKIAIIGAGAGGSSAAFWIAKAKQRFGLDVEVDVYEKSNYIGGRSTVVYPYDNKELQPVELGASIFVEDNKNLWRAIEEFDLEKIDFGKDDSVMGLWDGSQILLTTGGKGFYTGWLDTVKVAWRYGFSAHRRAKATVQSMIDTYLTLYAPSAPRFSNITTLAEELDWTPILAQTAAEYLDTKGINRQYTRELVDALTRVNYGQNVDAIHALEGMCSMAADGASSVKGGNFQLFEEFVKRSNASVSLETAVTALKHDEASGAWLVSTADSRQAYRAVILAAPFHSANISLFPEALAESFPEQPYVRLHVTLLSTPAPSPNSAYFGLGAHSAPTTLLTTANAVREGTGAEPEFNSLTYHGKVRAADGEPWAGEAGEEWVVKIFSKKRLTDDWLENMFGKVGWVLRKEWDAYPVLPPTTSFAPIKVTEGLYYVNAFEPFISTMETETIAARNVVDLLLHDEFGAAICPIKLVEEIDIEEHTVVLEDGEEAEVYDVKVDVEQVPVEEKDPKSFVLGWDC
ncbi:FAD/NAD(P)-binding domain-containing protein [Laetiporus sulphureus 93-53]|uniref:FAD/NAD(P)-binding domain-containing protein n=1 Tax=Laetiporus sulphureus 93-53 TaxID=1314785 RepID=A0A165EB67_9APHY|nr:FAD/NAD(P)-binding domain-containing protein [Laetiporus sulphureus 93-53]KZT06641.1 FAD/NAD(P)-binding domain-containing protein [Laetiporus sulphureus 93-53]